MPIKIPNTLPAKAVLEKENIFVIDEQRAIMQDIRPLKILIVNIMPNKIETEIQLLRVLSNTPLQVDVELLSMKSHVSKNTSQEHLTRFYKAFNDIKNLKFDGMIITGAPVEHLEFQQVTYWEELSEIMEWSKTNVFSTFHICWAALAGLHYHFGIRKHELNKKLSGIYEHTVLQPNHQLFNGFDDIFYAPHSRYSTVYTQDIIGDKRLSLLSVSKDAGVHIVADSTDRNFFVTGHSEYDRTSLANEYRRDVEKGLNPNPPANYFQDNNPNNIPTFTWRAHANLLFSNWLNYFVYQATPYNLNQLPFTV